MRRRIEAIPNSTSTLVKHDRIEHLVESPAGTTPGRSRHRFLRIVSERVVPTTPTRSWTDGLPHDRSRPGRWPPGHVVHRAPVLPPDVTRNEVRLGRRPARPAPARGRARGPRLGCSAYRGTRGAAGHPRSAGGLAAVVAAVVAAAGASQGGPPARWLCDREADLRELARVWRFRHSFIYPSGFPRRRPRRRQHRRAPLPGGQGGRVRAGQERQPGPAWLRSALVRLHELLRAARRRRRRWPRPGPARRQRPRHYRLLVQRAVPDGPGGPRRPPRSTSWRLGPRSMRAGSGSRGNPAGRTRPTGSPRPRRPGQA